MFSSSAETIDPINFVNSRVKEVTAIEEEIRVRSLSGTKQAFQRLPKFLRRRAASHNSKRLPRRFRKQEACQGVSTQGNKKSRSRAKSSNSIKRLDTHEWHAKRCEMTSRYGFLLPFATNEKKITACLRASRFSFFIYDLSYYTALSCDVENLDKTCNLKYDRNLTGLQSCEIHFMDGIYPSFLDLNDTQAYIFLHPVLEPIVIHHLSIGWKKLESSIFYLAGPKALGSVQYILAAETDSCIHASNDKNVVLIRCPRSVGYNVWKKLIYGGACFGALTEFKNVIHQAGKRLFPYDYATPISFDYLQNFNSETNIELLKKRPIAKIDLVFLESQVSVLKHFALKSGSLSWQQGVLDKGHLDGLNFIFVAEGSNPVGYISSGYFSTSLGKFAVNCHIDPGFIRDTNLFSRNSQGHVVPIRLVK